jgi:lipopolysaccharide biosynthesis glycosyltransferase
MTNPTYQINIAFIADDAYAQHAGVMLVSLFLTNPNLSFNIYHLSFGISEDNKEKLMSLCQSYNASIFFLEERKSRFDGLKTGRWNEIMYLKILLPELLPLNIERVLFLDVDMIINHSVENLYNINLKNNEILAAAEDEPECIGIKKRISLSVDDLYINSGVVVFDLIKWREKEKKTPLIDYIQTVKDIIVNDQDLIALYFKNQICCLPIQWNMTTFYYFRKPLIFDKYLPYLEESKKNPYIIHFAAPIKPWYKDCQHPFACLYRFYLKKTPWKDVKLNYDEFNTFYKRRKHQIWLLLNRLNIIKHEKFLLK